MHLNGVGGYTVNALRAARLARLKRVDRALQLAQGHTLRGQSQNAVGIGSGGREHDRDTRRLVILAALDFEGERAERAHGLILIRALSLCGPSPPGQAPGEALGQVPHETFAALPDRPSCRSSL